MRVWQGRTPGGYPLVIELDDRNRWIATVANASRSRNDSLKAALLEAGGTTITPEWADRLIASILARVSSSDATGASDGVRRR